MSPTTPHDAVNRVSKSPRHYELDWLRTVVVLGLIPVHTANMFSAAPDIFLKNRETTASLVVLGTFVGVFGMPLLFLVSGAASWFALGIRPPARYIRERVIRLLVPLIFATLVIIPVQVYVVLLSNPDLVRLVPMHIGDRHYLDSYIRYFPQYLAGYAYFLTHLSLTGVIIFFGHLWFIVCLFVVSLVCLPLFVALRSATGQRLISHLASFCALPGAILLLGLPLSLAEAGFRVAVPALAALSDVLVYALFFVLGYILYSDQRFARPIRQYGLLALGLGVASWLLAEIAVIKGQVRPYDASMGQLFFLPLRSIIAWFWVVAILAFGMRFLAVSGRAQRYLTEAAYPIYVLHVAVIVVVGFYVVQWHAGILPKYLAVIVFTVAILIPIFDLVIRRIDVLRFLFGLKPLPRRTASS